MAPNDPACIASAGHIASAGRTIGLSPHADQIVVVVDEYSAGRTIGLSPHARVRLWARPLQGPGAPACPPGFVTPGLHGLHPARCRRP